MSLCQLGNLFNIDLVSNILVTLIIFIGITIYFFSKKYFDDDTRKTKFLWHILQLCGSLIVVVTIDHIGLFIGALFYSNLLITKMIAYNQNWEAAKAAAKLTRKYFLVGNLFILLAFILFYKINGSVSIKSIIYNNNGIETLSIIFALILLLFGTIIQSGIWPFHTWLISSLNSPTPSLAIMHTLLVSMGGFILTRFANLYLSNSIMLSIIFIVGLATVVIGTLWKLMQHDVKRMLACSTMEQMGFVFVQCGLGLFPAAIAHLCLHSMFKAYLFLNSASLEQKQRLEFSYPLNSIKLLPLLLVLLCGIAGSCTFSLIIGKTWFIKDTRVFLVGVVFIASSQLVLTVLRYRLFKMLPIAIIASFIIGSLYGSNIYLINSILTPLNLMIPQPLSIIYLIGCILLLLVWLLMMFSHKLYYSKTLPDWLLWLYVKAFNSSQPDPLTITAYRNNYQY